MNEAAEKGRLADNIPVWRRHLREPRALAILGALFLLLWFLGGSVGPLLAVCLVPRALKPRDAEPFEWHPWIDFLLASLSGILLLILCHWAWAPSLLTGGNTVASDIAEHFWLLHSVENPGWEGWSANRYPLPTLMAHLFSSAGNSYQTWYLAALASMVGIGFGLYYWGRAVAGVGAGLCAVLLTGAFPDLVLMVRTATAYPEMVVLWTVGAGFVAYALRFPRPVTCFLAGLGVATIFASDSRGFLAGLCTLPMALLACLLARGYKRKALSLLLCLAPIALSWVAHARLPMRFFSIEEQLESSIGDSYRRAGLPPPTRAHDHPSAYIWGKYDPTQIPTTLRAMLSARSRLNQEIKSAPEQIDSVDQRLMPLILPTLLLSVLGILLGAGVPPSWRMREWRAWLECFDWRGKSGLAPVAASLSIFVNVLIYAYFPRYSGMATPALIVMVVVGITALGGRRAPEAAYVLVAFLILYVVPSAYNTHAAWRPLTATPSELSQCLAAANGGASEGLPPSSLPPSTENCVRAQKEPLKGKVKWPY